MPFLAMSHHLTVSLTLRRVFYTYNFIEVINIFRKQDQPVKIWNVNIF